MKICDVQREKERGWKKKKKKKEKWKKEKNLSNQYNQVHKIFNKFKLKKDQMIKQLMRAMSLKSQIFTNLEEKKKKS